MADNKNKPDIDPKEVEILADAVMIRSDVLMKTKKLTRQEADSLALKQVNSARKTKGLEYIKGYVKNKGKGFVIGPAVRGSQSPGSGKNTTENTKTTSTTSPGATPTSTTVPPSQTTNPTGSSSATSSASSYDLNVPGASQRQLESALAAKLDPNVKQYEILGYGWATKQQRDELINSLKTRIATNKKLPGSPEFIYESQNDWVSKRAEAYVVVNGLTPAAANTKARAEVETEIGSQDPYAVLPLTNQETPGSAKKQLAAMTKAKLDPATKRWKVPGYGFYSQQEYTEILANLKTATATDPTPDADTPDTSGSGAGSTGGKGKDYGNKKPLKPVSGDTYTNSKNVKFTYQNGKWVRTATLGTTGATVVVDGKNVTVGSQQWKTIVQQEFGSMWDVYNSDQEVKKVIDESVRLGYFDDETKMTAKLQNTTWFRTTQQSARQFAIQQSTDPATTEAKITATIEDMRANAGAQGLTLNDMTLRKLATDSLKFGWSDQQKLNALGSEQVAQAQLGGPQGMANLRQSSVGRNLRAKAATYFQKPSEQLIGTWTQQVLTGQKSEVQWDELMRNSARTQFRSLQPALDRGEDVDTAMYAYKQQVAATLGSSIDASQIDWTQDKWNKALNFRDPKTNEYRQMDLWEWNTYLRSLPEWQNTDEAKRAYGNLAQSLARGFGKTA